LKPVIVELALWSDEYLRELNKIMRNTEEHKFMRSNKEEFINVLKRNYKEKLATKQNA